MKIGAKDFWETLISDGSIRINQEDHTEKILKYFRLYYANAVATPIGKEKVENSPNVKGKVP